MPKYLTRKQLKIEIDCKKEMRLCSAKNLCENSRFVMLFVEQDPLGKPTNTDLEFHGNTWKL
jgi:hypothetical protein